MKKTREFKFRVWDGKMNDWETVKKLVILGHIFNDKRYKVMQYTGVKDSKGKEIFENDIVMYGGTDAVDMVVFDNGCFCTDGGGYLLDEFKDLQVIGHRYDDYWNNSKFNK